MCAQVASIGLHDDMEEDLVGTDWHQRAISSLYTSLSDVAQRAGLPWHVGNQLTLVAWKPDGTAWRPSPDIMVHPQGGPAPRKEMVARTDGAPALVVEVASESTWSYDADTAEGKAAGYLALGVPEYLIFDPTGDFLGGAPCRGWRLVDGAAQEWRPTADGRYASALGLSMRPDGDRLRVLDRAGNPMPYEYEKTWELAERERMLAERDAERARMVAERERMVAERDAEIARLSAELERARRQTGPAATPATEIGDVSDAGDDIH